MTLLPFLVLPFFPLPYIFFPPGMRPEGCLPHLLYLKDKPAGKGYQFGVGCLGSAPILTVGKLARAVSHQTPLLDEAMRLLYWGGFSSRGRRKCYRADLAPTLLFFVFVFKFLFFVFYQLRSPRSIYIIFFIVGSTTLLFRPGRECQHCRRFTHLAPVGSVPNPSLSRIATRHYTWPISLSPHDLQPPTTGPYPDFRCTFRANVLNHD